MPFPISIRKYAPSLVAIINPLVAAPANAYVLDHVVKYLEPEYKDSDRVYWAGFFIAFGAAVIQSMAMLYYQSEKNKKQSLPCHGHSHSGSHIHAHRDTHETNHFWEHFFGLYLFNFCFAVSGTYYVFLKDEIPENNNETIKVSLAIAFAGLINAYVEAAIHETFLEHVHEEDKSIWHGLYKQLVTKVLDKDKTLGQSLKQFWYSAGGLGSHASAGYFAVYHAFLTLLLLCGYKKPHAYIDWLGKSLAIGFGGYGAILHVNSELKAVEKAPELATAWAEIKRMDSRSKQALILLFLMACFVCVFFHVLPESIAINEETTKKSADLLERSLRVAGCGLALGVPDIVMSMALNSQGALKFMKQKLDGGSSNSETAPILSSSSINNNLG